jgi:hypothetical protein
MSVCEFRAHCARVPVLQPPASGAEPLYTLDDFDEEPVVSARTRRMMLVSSFVGAVIWTIILRLIF